MSNRTQLLVGGWVFAIAAALPGNGNTQTADPATQAQTAEQDETALEQIPQTLESLKAAKAGEYGKLDRETRQKLDSAERDITKVMRDNPDLRTLNDDNRMRLFNAQESVVAVVTGLKGSQLVCTYRQNIGTRFKTKQCVTRDMAEATKKNSRDAVHSMQNPMCVPGEGKTC